MAKSDARYGYRTSKLGTIPALQLDAIVTQQILGVPQSPEATQAVWDRVQAVWDRVQAVWDRVQALEPRIAEPILVLAIRNLGAVWQQLFSEEQ